MLTAEFKGIRDSYGNDTKSWFKLTELHSIVRAPTRMFLNIYINICFYGPSEVTFTFHIEKASIFIVYKDRCLPKYLPFIEDFLSQVISL